jgi:predicted amidohydrolase YtcJ
VDAIFANGTIHTLDGEGTIAQAVGISNGFVEALGYEADLRRLATHQTEMIDLRGAVMFPGFVDVHSHPMLYGYLTTGMDLAPPNVTRLDHILELIKGEAETTPPGIWIKGSRYAEYHLPENRHPTRRDLDPVSPDHPVVLFHTSLHACVLNSLALAECGITRETPAPRGGIIEREDDTGEPTGVLHDAAMMDVLHEVFDKELASMTSSERVAMCGLATRKYAELGLVATGDAMVTPLTLGIYQDTLAAGELMIRIYTMNLVDACEPLVASGIRTGFGGPYLQIGPVKMFGDGGISSRTAAMRSPYLTPPHDRGLKVMNRGEVAAAVRRYHGWGYQLAIHSQGDDGLNDVLDAYEAVLGSHSTNPLRHRIEHAGCLFRDLLGRAADMNIAVAIQPGFIGELGDGILEALGQERANRIFPFRSMLRAGMCLGGSSDCPVALLDPRLGLRDAVLRRTRAGQLLGPEEALTKDQALRLYTVNAAYLSLEEQICGTIELGKRADFTVLAADPRDLPAEEIPSIPIVMTVVNGTVAYSAP